MPWRDKKHQQEYTQRYYQKKRKDPKWVAKRQADAREYVKTRVTSEQRMLCSAKARARKIGVPFDLELEDIRIPEVCPLLGIPIIEGHAKGSRGATANSPSLDRIRPELGYVKGNVWVVSYRANVIKQNATPDELERIATQLRQRLSTLHAA